MTLEKKNIYKSMRSQIRANERGEFLVNIAKSVSESNLSDSNKKYLYQLMQEKYDELTSLSLYEMFEEIY